MLHWLRSNCQSRFPCLPKTDNHFGQSETWMTRVSLRFWFALVDYLQRVHAALAESCSVADLKGLRTFTTFSIIFPSLLVILFFSVWRRIKESKTSRRDSRSQITWGGGQTARRTLKTRLLRPFLTTDTKTILSRSREKRPFSYAGNIANNFYMCLSVFIHSNSGIIP